MRHPIIGRVWQQRLSLFLQTLLQVKVLSGPKQLYWAHLHAVTFLFFSCFHLCLCLSCAEEEGEEEVLLSVWVLLTELKFQTRLKESLFLRLILLSSHTGSTCLHHTNTSAHLWLPSFFRGCGDSRMDPSLRTSASQPACTRHSTVHPPLASLHAKTRCASTHAAPSQMRKFHSLAGMHRFHRDTPPSGCTNREEEGVKRPAANRTAAWLLLHLCSNHA